MNEFYKRHIQLFIILILSLHASAGWTTTLPDLSQQPGGLAVFLGQPKGETLQSLAALAQQPQWSVHILVPSTANAPLSEDQLQELRRELSSLSKQGDIAVSFFNGVNLPHHNNLVNALLVREGQQVPENEQMRVLAPRGSLYAQADGSWQQKEKAVPEELDDWPMALYEPSNNAVSKDEMVGPPSHQQWRSGPSWTRNHELMNSLTAMISMNGIVYYVIDEGVRFSAVLPEKWMLVAQDGFNGKILWKRQLETWHNHLWPVKSGPVQLQRRLVAIGDSLFLPITAGGALSEIDGKTGELIRQYEGTEGLEEINYHGDSLVIVTGESAERQKDYELSTTHVWNAAGNTTVKYGFKGHESKVVELDRVSGEVKWSYTTPVVSTTLAVDDHRVYLHNGTQVIGLDRESGTKLWEGKEHTLKKYKLGVATAPTLIVYDNTVLCTTGFDFKDGKLHAYDRKTGRLKWTNKHPSSGHSSQDDLFVIDGIPWCGAIARMGHQDGAFSGHHMEYGEVVKSVPLDKKPNSWFHQRCYRSKATENYIIPGATGTEYVDLKKGTWTLHHWLRGACINGLLPANGLSYGTPHPCGCFTESMLRGFCGLASSEMQQAVIEPNYQPRLIRGPAFERELSADVDTDNSWPTFRNTQAREAYSSCSISPELNVSWKAAPAPGEKMTQPVVGYGKVFSAAVNRHVLYAMDQSSGEVVWSYATSGRIDSPPALWKGRVIVGSNDGHLYCLDASDGALVWRFRGAAEERLMMVDDQVESVWPVHGNNLIIDDTIYCLAGRTIFLDGGLRLAQLDAATGELQSEEIHGDTYEATGKELQMMNQGLKMVPGNSDILVYDGKHIYMNSQRIGLDGKRIYSLGGGKDKRTLTISNSDQDGEGTHLFAPMGFVDGSWHHRSYWVYGRSTGSGWGGWYKPGKFVPTGRTMVVKPDATVYAFGRQPAFFGQAHIMEYMIYSAQGQAYEAGDWKKTWIPIKEKKVEMTDWKKNIDKPVELLSAVHFKWRKENPAIFGRAMVGAGDLLFMAGPPDVVDEKSLYGTFGSEGNVARLKRQEAALTGAEGSQLWVMSMEDGEPLAKYDMESAPVFDGMAVVKGQLFVTLLDGTIVRYAEKL